MMNSIFIYFLLIEFVNSLHLVINGDYLQIEIDQSCEYLSSTKVSPSLKCVILCEMVNCTSLEFKSSSIPFPVCNITDPDPKLIQNFSITGLTVNYILSNDRSLNLHIFS